MNKLLHNINFFRVYNNFHCFLLHILQTSSCCLGFLFLISLVGYLVVQLAVGCLFRIWNFRIKNINVRVFEAKILK